MLLIVLFTILLFLTPQAEAHVGVSSDHEDTNRPYDQEGDADHRHKIRAIGVSSEDYTKTHLEDDGLGTKIVSIPIFDRDSSMSPCYEIDIRELETAYSYTHRRNPHPFAGEGMTYPTLNPPHNVSVIAVGVEIAWAGGSGQGLDYETAPGSDEIGKYYDYTITAWDEADVGGSNCRNSVDSEWKVSETFRLYVTDVDETINYPPTFERPMEQMAVFENAASDVEICCGIVDIEDRDTEPEDLVYSLNGADASAFRITTGKTYPAGDGLPNGFIYATQTFDYETKNRYEVTAHVEDPEGLFLERSFTIHVVDVVNEGCTPPHFPGNGISPFDVRIHLSNTDSNGNIRPYNDGNCTSGGSTGNNPGSGSGSGSGRSGSSGGSSGGSRGGGSSGSGGSGNSDGINVGSSSTPNGHVDYCRDYGPCAVGEGDCDSTSECQSGLQCSQDVGANYGFRADYDVCEAAPNSVQQYGHVDYCRDFGPCGVGEGDCDGNSQCQSGLQCSQDVGASYGFRADYDVCEATFEGGTNGHVDYCRDYGPCEVGQGDCDSTSECQSGLQCSRDIGANYGFPANYDVCEADPERGENGHVDYCRDYGPCGVGEGDCDSASECESGLQCNRDIGTNYGFPPNYDVCE